jgi:hypothetical protein
LSDRSIHFVFLLLYHFISNPNPCQQKTASFLNWRF